MFDIVPFSTLPLLPVISSYFSEILSSRGAGMDPVNLQIWKKWGKSRQKSVTETRERSDLDRSSSIQPSPSQSQPISGDSELPESSGQLLVNDPQQRSTATSFFESASDVKVLGGHFTSDLSRSHQTNVTIVVNSSESKAKSPADGSQDTLPQSSEGLTTPIAEVQKLPQSRGGEASTNLSGRIDLLLRVPSLPVQKSSTLYYRHLASKGRGSPLWIPEPSNTLPITYQRNGIAIGDVGILTDYGSFNFLFNICLPASDPINSDDVPEEFQPLPLPRPSDIDEHLEFKSNSYLASSLVETFQHDEDPIGLMFESSASEGAILTMPNGSRSRDLANVVNFRKYAYANAEKWYKYANEVRGRGARNGDLRLVTGYHSSDAWGMATFANLSTSNTSSSNKQTGFRLKFKPMKGDNTGRTYGWECSGTAEVKSGPDRAEIERLRNGVGSDLDEGDIGFENQCLFVRTLNVTLQKDVWEKLSVEWAALYLDDEPWSESSPSSFDRSGAHSGDTAGDNTRSGRGGGRQGDAPRDSDLHPQDSQPATPSSTQSSPQQIRNPVLLSSLLTPLDFHPSKMINKFLLRERPMLKMAITEDENWISTLNKDEQVLPSQKVICERSIAMHDICEDDGIVFLRPKSAESPTPTQPTTALRKRSFVKSILSRYGRRDTRKNDSTTSSSAAPLLDLVDAFGGPTTSLAELHPGLRSPRYNPPPRTAHSYMSGLTSPSNLLNQQYLEEGSRSRSGDPSYYSYIGSRVLPPPQQNMWSMEPEENQYTRRTLRYLPPTYIASSSSKKISSPHAPQNTLPETSEDADNPLAMYQYTGSSRYNPPTYGETLNPSTDRKQILFNPKQPGPAFWEPDPLPGLLLSNPQVTGPTTEPTKNSSPTSGLEPNRAIESP